MKRLILAVAFIAFARLTGCTGSVEIKSTLPKYKPIDIYTIAEEITGCPAFILYGIASAESDFMASAIGDGGKSLGMFQINETFRDLRVQKYGEYNPFNPIDSAIIAGFIMAENMAVFGDYHQAICAYRQGIGGVQRNGAITWYSEKVLKEGNKYISEEVL